MERVGKRIPRVDAYEKVTGRAQYTDDLFEREALVIKVCHATVANGYVTHIDVEKALKVPGVVKIVTCLDVPDIEFPTAGHPWSTDPKHQDISDRKLLNRRVRYYGDDVAAVVAEDEVAAMRAVRLIQVDYEQYPPVFTAREAMAPGASTLHEAKPNNVIASSSYELGDYQAATALPGLVKTAGVYVCQPVQHCHIENPISYAYVEKGRVVVVASTQIPHIMRRVVAQALGIKWGDVRVIKPYIGGGFGNKQDVLYEPLCAYLSTQVGGRLVKLDVSREETFASTRSRHGMEIAIESYAHPDGRLVARSYDSLCPNGAYASHGHAIAANGLNGFRHLYRDEVASRGSATTVYTNRPASGAMRGYGIPQLNFALESHMDDVAWALKLDPTVVREMNMMEQGYVDPYTGIACNTCGLKACIEKGKKYVDWDKKRALYARETGPIRRGVGMAIFSYKTGVYPISLETAACRMTLNQDGSVQLMMGATEIGQGADTVFTQMAAETLNVPIESVHILSTQDTDISPFDPGAYASRQTYVSGRAVKMTAEKLLEEILTYAGEMLGRECAGLALEDAVVVDALSGEALLPLADVALEATYSLTHSKHLAAECTSQTKDNTFSLGATFVEIEVDLPLGKIDVKKIINVHDCGTLINPQLAEMQVHGGMSMALGMVLGEQMIFDPKTGRLLNGNLLDYKMMTALDTPDLQADFVETYDPTGPYGNKALGEPPAISGMAAVRNALLQATGIGFNELPLAPQKLVERFKQAGLI
ncbi:MAG: xanthine dehydrogenase molybdenum-binding subunit XdhA [Clostridia bacterium]